MVQLLCLSLVLCVASPLGGRYVNGAGGNYEVQGGKGIF